MIVVKDKSTGKYLSSVKADSRKDCRTSCKNPNISSVEITYYGKSSEEPDEAKSGQENCVSSKKAGQRL